MTFKKLPSRPWEHIAVDFKGLLLSGDYLLVVIGEYSMFDEIEITKPAYLWFQVFSSTVDLLTVVFDIIARAFNRSGATRAVALDTLKAFGMGLAGWSFSQT